MGFFQNSVIHKYIQSLDKQTLQNAYAKFRLHFHNAAIQDNIRGSKEEQYQGEFLIDLFVNVLGYTKNPTPNFNLTTEYKNVKDSKKADGAIIINETVKAVIELKGTNTTDLNKIETQAFGYKNNQPDCDYVITSNFEKIRFYVDNAIEYVEFNLFTLTEKEFELLYICLSYDSISRGIPKQIKDESVSQEALITKKLYNDYSVFKSELYHSLVKLNPQYEPLELFKKSQKLLDRFLFIFFAEDRQLLPTNLIFRINKEWQQLREMRIEVSLYERYKIYFHDLDQGAKVSLPAFSQTTSKQKEEFQIYAYNGGLFKKDDLLNDIKIEDELLFTHTEKLSNYDFASEVDVNVLGHIFENSLNELDEIKAQLEGQEIDKTKTKRKKDGVFYTPKYITKYIVDNTVGKLCLEKKEALQLLESDYIIDKKRQKKTTQALTDKLNEYRHWLLQLTICDPACGSGAFLNQALDFLINEHKYIDELQAKLFGDALVLSDVEGSILENNLFGVDINEESVEIAKLSLWLRTAQPNRKLNDLNSNIKCGNSLIDDIAVAGDKAFNWENEFKQVFEKGGFDVVIGNPPYVLSRDNKLEDYKLYLNSKFSLTKEKANLYLIFIERTYSLLKSNGQFGFVVPNSLLGIESAEGLREFLLLNVSLNKIINLVGESFPGVSVETIIFTYCKKNDNKETTKYLKTDKPFINELEYKEIFQSEWLKNRSFIIDVLSDSFENKIIEKILFNSVLISEKYNVKVGLQAYEKGKGTPPQTAEDVKNHVFDFNFQFDNDTYRYFNGGDVSRYGYNWSGQWLRHGKWLSQPKELNQFSSDRILIREITSSYPKVLSCAFLQDTYLNNKSIINILAISDSYNLKYLLPLLNSKLLGFFHLRRSVKGNRELFPKIVINDIKNFPIKAVSIQVQQPFIEKADLMLSFQNSLQEIALKFQRSLERKFNLDSLPKKLEDWYLLSYSDFIKELAKKKIKLSLSDEAEWEEYFNTESKKALELKSKIDTTDKEIDQMVYKLYDLTEEEIAIVEKS